MSDYIGLATLLGSITSSVVAVVGLWRGRERDKKLAIVHDLVNGQSKKIEALTFQAGEISGADKERAAPTTGNQPL